MSVPPLPPDLSTSLKAGFLLAALLDGGVAPEHISLRRHGDFRKTFRPDIAEATLENLPGGTPAWRLGLNRAGIYDALPEGLFHQPRRTDGTHQVSGMVGQYRRFREEERNARQFFQPLEQELTLCGAKAELEERRIVLGLLRNELPAEWQRFWGLEDCDASWAGDAARLLPWAHAIKGDADLTASALTVLTGKAVEVAISIEALATVPGSERAGLGEARLGENMLAGATCADPATQWTFRLRGCNAAEAAALLGSRAVRSGILAFFESRLCPVDVIVSYEFADLPPETDDAGLPILGYTLYL